MSFFTRRRRQLTKPLPGARVDWGHPLARGLVGCWLFNEGGGTRVRNHGSWGPAYDATSTTTTQGWEQGPAGAASALNRSNRVFDVSSPPQAPKLSIVCRYKTSSGSQGQIMNRDQAAGQRVWQFRNDPGALRAIFYNSSGGAAGEATSASTINDGKWHQLAATWDLATIQCFVDGRANGTAVSYAGPMTAQAAQLRFCGDSSFAGNGDVGSIDYAYVYDRALSPAEIEQLYFDPFCMFMQPRRQLFNASRLLAIQIDPLSLPITPQAFNLVRKRFLSVAPFSLPITGQSLILREGRRLHIDPLQLAITMRDLDLINAGSLVVHTFGGSFAASYYGRSEGIAAAAATTGEMTEGDCGATIGVTAEPTEATISAGAESTGFDPSTVANVSAEATSLAESEARGCVSVGEPGDGAAMGATEVDTGEGLLAICDVISETLEAAR